MPGIIVLIGFCSIIYLLPEGDYEDASTGINIVLTIVFVIIGYALRAVFKSSEHLMPGAIEMMEQDKRSPVLYLRAFDADQDKLNTQQQIHRYQNPQAFFLAWAMPIISFEQSLTIRLNRVGPVVALSKPGAEDEQGVAKLPEFPNEKWKEAVLDLVNDSRIIVLRAAYAGSVLWELDKLQTNRNMKGVIFWIQFAGAQDKKLIHARYKHFANTIEGISGKPLPKTAKSGSFIALDNKGEFQVQSLDEAIKVATGTKGDGIRTYLQAMMPLAAPTIEQRSTLSPKPKAGLFCLVAAFISIISMISGLVVNIPLPIMIAIPLLIGACLAPLRRHWGIYGRLYDVITFFVMISHLFYIMVILSGLFDTEYYLEDTGASMIFLIVFVLWAWLISFVYSVPIKEKFFASLPDYKVSSESNRQH